MRGVPLGGIVLWPGQLDGVSPLVRCDGSDAGSSGQLGPWLAGRFGQSSAGSSLLPDLLGRFARGAGRGDNPGASGSSSFQAHQHGYETFPTDTSSDMVAIDSASQWYGAHDTLTSGTVAAGKLPPSWLSGNESRPVNIYLHFLISAGEEA